MRFLFLFFLNVSAVFLSCCLLSYLLHTVRLHRCGRLPQSGAVVVAWMDNRNDGWWNVWARKSTDFGQTWSAQVRLSNAQHAPYAVCVVVLSFLFVCVCVRSLFSVLTFRSVSVRFVPFLAHSYHWKRADGSFKFPFGDYAAAYMDSNSRAHLTWGEGNGWVRARRWIHA